MATFIQYQLVPPLTTASYGGGNIWVSEGRTYDVKAGLTAGSGTILADTTDSSLLQALDRYPPLQRVGTTTIGPAPTVKYTLPLMATLTDPQAGDALQLNNDLRTAYNVPTAGTGGGPIQETDLAPALLAKVNTRVPTGRVALGTAASPAALGAGTTVALLSTDDQGQVNIYVQLTADGTLTISGVQLVTWCTIRITALQDGTGNHTFAVKNALNSKVDQITVDLAPNAGTFTYCYTDDSANITVVGPDTSAGGTGTGTGISKPTFTGTPGSGNVLTATAPPELLASSVTWQWQNSTNGVTWSDIASATANTYTQQTTDQGKQLTPRVAGTPFARGTPILVPSTQIAFVATAQQTTITSATVIVPRPASVIDADVLFAAITFPAGAATTITAIPATTGGTDWTPMGAGAGGTVAAGRYQEINSGLLMFLYWKRIASGDATTSWNFTASTGTLSYRTRTAAFRNAHATGTPFEDFAQSFKTTSTSLPFGAPTATNANSMEISVAGFPQQTAVTWPATEPTFQDVSGSDYQKFGYRFLTASGVGSAITGTLNQSSRAIEARWVVLPLP